MKSSTRPRTTTNARNVRTTCRVCKRTLPDKVFRPVIVGGRIQDPACRPCAVRLTTDAGDGKDAATELVAALSNAQRDKLRAWLAKADLLIGEWDFSFDYAVLDGVPSIEALLGGYRPRTGATIGRYDEPAWAGSVAGVPPHRLAYYESTMSNNDLRAALSLRQKRNRKKTTRRSASNDDLFSF